MAGNIYRTIGLTLTGCSLLAMLSIAGYAKIWERKQPLQSINAAQVASIQPYSKHNDLHWTRHGYRVQIEGDERVIDFPRSNWDDKVEENSSVDLVVRRSFPWFEDELDGIEITLSN